MREKLFLAVILAASLEAAGINPGYAFGGCGPHSRLAYTKPMPNGGTYYQCVCTDGWVPSSTATVTVPKGSSARPPPCVPPGRARSATRSAPAVQERPKRRGSYQAKPAHENAPKREDRPASEERKPKNVIGATAPAQKNPQPGASVPPPVRPDTPTLGSSAPAWSDRIVANEKVRAAVELGEKSYARIKDVPLPSPQALREQAREAAKENAVKSLFEKVPAGELVTTIRDMAKDMKELGKSRADAAREYLTHWYDLASDVARCSGSASTQCARSIDDEAAAKKYGDTEAGRKDSWLTKEFGKGADVMREKE